MPRNRYTLEEYRRAGEAEVLLSGHPHPPLVDGHQVLC